MIRYFSYILISVWILSVPIGAEMITTMYSYTFKYDVEYNKKIEKSKVGRASLRVNATETVESKIPLLYDTITYASPYQVYLNIYSKSKNITIKKAFILIDGKERVELNRALTFNYQDEDYFRFETQSQSIDFDVDSIHYIEAIIELDIEGNLVYNKERYILEYKKETGNRLWWAMMSV